MNPLMKENQILRMISDALSKHLSLYWIEFYCQRKNILRVAIPNEHETYESLMGVSMEVVRDKVVEDLFDLSMHHYISNVKRISRFLRINFKECRGGRLPNFGIRTVKKVMTIIETGSIPKTHSKVLP